MRKLLLALTLSAFALAASGQPKAVFIIVDGIPADVIEKLQPPVLMEIAGTSGYTRSFTGGIAGTYNETPTISAPGYNNLITGVWGNKHNVHDNDIEAPNYHYKNLFGLAKEVNPKLQTTVFSTWTDNRTKLIGEAVKVDHSFDGLELDTVNYPHDRDASHIRKIDEAVALEAARYITQQGPDLSWVYLEYTDDMGHRYGDSPQFNEAILSADRLIGKIWESVKTRQHSMGEDWLVIVTTDHGRDAATGKDHGGQSERERATWIVTNSKKLNVHFKQNPAVVDIFPSICRHLAIPIPEMVAAELDGIPFIGEIDFSDLKATRNGNSITLQWNSYLPKSDKSELSVQVAVTNHFKKGEPDQYLTIGKVPVAQGRHSFSFQSQSQFFKIVLRSKNQVANTWIGK